MRIILLLIFISAKNEQRFFFVTRRIILMSVFHMHGKYNELNAKYTTNPEWTSVTLPTTIRFLTSFLNKQRPMALCVSSNNH